MQAKKKDRKNRISPGNGCWVTAPDPRKTDMDIYPVHGGNPDLYMAYSAEESWRFFRFVCRNGVPLFLAEDLWPDLGYPSEKELLSRIKPVWWASRIQAPWAVSVQDRMNCVSASVNVLNPDGVRRAVCSAPGQVDEKLKEWLFQKVSAASELAKEQAGLVGEDEEAEEDEEDEEAEEAEEAEETLVEYLLRNPGEAVSLLTCLEEAKEEVRRIEKEVRSLPNLKKLGFHTGDDGDYFSVSQVAALLSDEHRKVSPLNFSPDLLRKSAERMGALPAPRRGVRWHAQAWARAYALDVYRLKDGDERYRLSKVCMMGLEKK